MAVDPSRLLLQSLVLWVGIVVNCARVCPHWGFQDVAWSSQMNCFDFCFYSDADPVYAFFLSHFQHESRCAGVSRQRIPRAPGCQKASTPCGCG